MLTPIRCFTCGLSLGDIAPIYRRIRQKRMAEKFAAGQVAPTQAAMSAGLTENTMGDILEALGVQGCCRTHLVTAMDFRDNY
jgi:DNA-directed RNA polymerase subunit N (RpoN/RPB10)